MSTTLLTGDRKSAPKLGRIPAQAIEEIVADRLAKLNASATFSWRDLRVVVQRIALDADGLTLHLTKSIAADAVARLREHTSFHDELCLDENGVCIWRVPLRLKRRGGAVRVLDPNGRLVVDEPQPDQSIVRALARAHRYRDLLARGVYRSAIALADAEGLTKAVIYRTLSLAYLAPDLTRAFLDGRQRPGLTLKQLMKTKMPLEWAAQRRLLAVNANER